MKTIKNQPSWKERIMPELKFHDNGSYEWFMEMITNGYEMEEQLLAEWLGLTEVK